MSLESTNFPRYYLRHRGYQFWVDRNDGTATFRADASFFRRAGLASDSAVPFEAQNFRGCFMRHYDKRLVLQQVLNATHREDATFTLE